MRYLYQAGKPRRVMHAQLFTLTGEPTFTALCGIRLAFNRSVNVPLGRALCKLCAKRLVRIKDDTMPAR